MSKIAKMIAAAGALTSGYLKGQELRREQDWQDEERKQKRQEWADKEALRQELAGGTSDRNAAVMTAGATDMADVNAFSSGGAVPRSAAAAQVVQRVGGNVTSDPTFAQSMADAENFASGADEGQTPKTEPRTAYRVPGAGIYDDPAQAIDASQQAGEDARMGAVKSGVKRPDEALDFLPQYLERIAPRVQSELIRQGKLPEAKAFQDLLDSQEGKTYTRNWTNAVRKIETGDLDGAVPDLAKLYTSYPDGRRAQATKLDGGRYQIDMIDEASGKTVNTFTLESGQLVRKAAMALRPEKLAEFLATQQGKRDTEAASLDKALQLEGLRQEGQEAREDRRDERLAARLDANAAALEKRLAADAERRASSGGLTAAQQRSNAEIDAAREAVSGMSPQDIARRTAKATNTGRENPDYDPGLARQAALAGRRKVGDDPEFDARSGSRSTPPESKKQTPIEAARAAMAADPAMKGYTLGEQTTKGFKVLDANGRLVGHYGRP